MMKDLSFAPEGVLSELGAAEAGAPIMNDSRLERVRCQKTQGVLFSAIAHIRKSLVEPDRYRLMDMRLKTRGNSPW